MNSSITKNRKKITPTNLDQPAKFKFNPIVTTAIISLIVPILYVIGRSYIDYYLKAYGVTSDLFEHTTQDYLFFALYGIFQTVWTSYLSFSTQWKPLIQLAFSISIVTFAYHYILKPELESTGQWLKQQPTLRKAIGSIIIGLLFLMFYYLLLLISTLTLASPMAVGQSAGTSIAKDEIKKDMGVCDTKTRKDLTACMQVSKNDKVITVGRVIASSANYVAVAKDGRATILPKDGLSFEVLK